jgi:hypothetical protein
VERVLLMAMQSPRTAPGTSHSLRTRDVCKTGGPPLPERYRLDNGSRVQLSALVATRGGDTSYFCSTGYRGRPGAFSASAASPLSLPLAKRIGGGQIDCGGHLVP